MIDTVSIPHELNHCAEVSLLMLQEMSNSLSDPECSGFQSNRIFKHLKFRKLQ